MVLYVSLLYKKKEKKMNKISSSDITPEHIYLSRRRFLKKFGLLATAFGITAGGSMINGCSPQTKDSSLVGTEGTPSASTSQINGETETSLKSQDGLTPYEDISSFTNFYEFSLSKSDTATLARDFKTDDWSIKIGGLVNHPQTFDLDNIKNLFNIKEYIYRMRCVEGWSMVIPWNGFSLGELLKIVEPTSDAKFVRFTSVIDIDQMPNQKSSMFNWPYVEGLRIDEAYNELCILSTGIYGKDLLPQNGAPIRLVTPWKYGYKSIKSIVEIELVSEMPNTFWVNANPDEYGFFANVNPDVNHPRWSQKTEFRYGMNNRIDTQKFNGYADKVTYLYEGMDLKAWF